jgi:PAS domain S-box-containing protein
MAQSRPSSLTHDESRRRLYRIIEDPELSLAEKREGVLELGTDYLGVDLGFVSSVDLVAGTFEVTASTDDGVLQEGASFPLSRTYCRKCIEADSALAVSDALEEGWREDPAYAEHGLGCYLGTPLRVDGEVVGTLCFADERTREPAFTPTERAFVELTAQVYGRERETAEYERELERRERDLDRRQQALERSERKYESLVEEAPDAVFLAEAETGTIVEANEAAAELTGYTEGGLVGRGMEVFNPAEDPAYWEQFQHSLDADGSITRHEDGTPVRIERADGTTVPVEISASYLELDGRTYVQGIARDISDRREREEELRLKDRAIDAAPVGVTIADAGGDNGLVYANGQFQEMTGYGWDELAGENCRKLQGPGTDRTPVDGIRAALSAEEPVHTELLNYRKDGTPFWNELLIAPVEDGRGETTHFVGFQRDVTDRKRKERLIQVLNRVLRHNLRNGMSVVLARAQHLREELDGAAVDGAADLDAITGRAKSLVELGRKANTISGAVGTEGEASATDVVPVVESVASELRRDHPDSDVSVTAPGSQRVVAPGALRAALSELGDNAAEHAGPGATVDIDVDSAGDGRVAVRVSDDGPGLPAEEREMLERGFETPLEHSSGLGLWFVNWVVTGAGGEVSARVEDGTTVTVMLRDGSGDGDSDRNGRQAAFGE